MSFQFISLLYRWCFHMFPSYFFHLLLFPHHFTPQKKSHHHHAVQRRGTLSANALALLNELAPMAVMLPPAVTTPQAKSLQMPPAPRMPQRTRSGMAADRVQNHYDVGNLWGKIGNVLKWMFIGLDGFIRFLKMMWWFRSRLRLLSYYKRSKMLEPQATTLLNLQKQRYPHQNGHPKHPIVVQSSCGHILYSQFPHHGMECLETTCKLYMLGIFPFKILAHTYLFTPHRTT